MSDRIAGGVKAGSTSVTINMPKLRAIADGTEITGKVAAGLTAYYWRVGVSTPVAPTAITLSDLAAITTAWTSGGVKEADATNMKGTYRLDVPNAAFATGADAVQIDLFATDGSSFVSSLTMALETSGAAEVFTVVSQIKTTTDGYGATLAGLPASVWLNGTRTLTSDVWDEVAASHNTAGTTGAVLNALSVAADPWNVSLPGAYASGKAGNILGNLPAPANSSIAAIKAVTDQFTFPATGKVAAILQIAGDFPQACADKVWTSAARTLTSFGTLVADVATAVWGATTRSLNSVGTIAAAVWEETASSHNTAGTTGNKLNAAASAGDPWNTTIPGAYAAGTAGYVVGNLGGDSADIDAIKAKTDQLTFSTPNIVDATPAAGITTTLATIQAKTDQLTFTVPNIVDASGGATPAAVADAVLNTVMTESYAADGAQATLAQLMYMLWAAATAEKVIVGTDVSVKGLNGTTTVMHFTLNDPVNPTSITRSS
ncbi:MAG TPA: hypothetical protein VFD85_01485 [Gemmatimonadales bacterium]|nr:hypothetical protein [Gemmatimonadales bacterium]